MFYKRINYFLEVANCLSFTEAARHKYITQQAMTWHISCLEQELGVKLFIRSTRSVNLTDAGKMLRDDFIRIDEEIRMAIDRVKGLEADKSAALTIGFFQGLSATRIVTPLMQALKKQFPDISFDVMLADMTSMRNLLMDGKVDLCITTASDWEDWPDTEVSVLKRFSFEIILSHHHPLAARKTLELDDLRGETLFALPPASMERKSPYWQNQVPRRRLVTLPDMSNLLINVQIGRGFACLVKIFEGADDPARFRSYPLPFEDAHAELICAGRRSLNNPLVHAVHQSIRRFYRE